MNLKILSIGGALLLVAAAGSTRAGSDIVSTTGGIIDLGTGPIPAGPVTANWLVKGHSGYTEVVFDEQQGVTLATPLATDAGTNPIGAGVVVDSALVVFNSNVPTRTTSSVTFDKRVLGVEFAENRMLLSPGLEISTFLERPGEGFADCPGCGFETATFDSAKIVGDTVDFTNAYDRPGDIARVILSGAAVPEPTAWTLALLGLGSLGAAMRVRRRRDSAPV